MRKAVGFLGGAGDVPEGFWYNVKRRLLGPPLVNEELGEQRLSKVLALGVLAPDGISSSAYGTEEILIELLRGGLYLTAFALIIPLTGVVLFVMALVVLSYREVVTVYTRAGGSYVVARDNFGPRVAQVAAVALLIDYVVTVAVQVAAGTAAVASAYRPINHATTITVISVIIVIVMCYGNLRGIREAGRSFAVPTYLFSGVVIVMIITGLVREAFGNLPLRPYPVPGQWTAAHSHSGLIAFAMVFVLLRAFANGGSSLTGIEAVSNAVSAFRPAEGINARRVLVTEGLILGSLVAGISWLAHATHAAPYTGGVPTVISQEARIVFGPSALGTALWILVQAATALILYTGGNTSFNGFPFLANFVAEDAFLPRWLTKRGHRLVFSNGIIVLAVLSCTLLVVVGANVNNLVPFYAIGVFTAFTMAGFGMARYHQRMKEPHWRRKLVINFSAGLTSMVVVLIFVVVKFTEGAFLVVILFIIGVPALIRLNREYRIESEVLDRIGARPRPPEPPNYPKRTVYVLVDSFDLATLAALRYARSLRPTRLRAVHFVIDTAQAEQLREEWMRADRGVVLDFIDCPDRRLTKAAAELVSAEAALPGVHVTTVLPRRSYSPLLGRLLHDRTADKIANVVSRIPHSAATIVPFDVRSRLEVLHERQVAAAAAEAAAKPTLVELAAAKRKATPPAPAGTGGKPAATGAAGESAAAGAVSEPAASGAADEPGGGGSDETAMPATAASGTGPAGPASPPASGRRGRAQAGDGPAPGPPGEQPPAVPGESGLAGADVGAPSPDGAAAAPADAPGDGRAAPPAGETPGAGAAADTRPRPPGTPAPSPRRGLLRGRRGERSAPGAAPVPDRSRASYDRPAPSPGVNPIGSLTQPGRATVEGRVRAVEIRPVPRNSVLAVEISDATGDLTALFYGRSHIPGIICGAKARFRGPVGIREGRPVMVNPAYELLAPGSTPPPAGEGS
ncbi:MAG TPA: amino acid permease [Streptosporangiaceae bacterium]